MSSDTITSDEVRSLIAHFAQKEGAVLSALQAVQSEYGYVPDAALDVVASVCNVSRAEVYGVFTFYSDFPQGKASKVDCQSVCCRSMPVHG